jgi:hypothetical protein
MTTRQTRIRAREKDSIIQSLKAGVTPRVGIQHIQVGRVNEIDAIYKDIDRIAQGGSAFRLIIGEYGSGKTFFSELSQINRSRKTTGVSQRGPVTGQADSRIRRPSQESLLRTHA